MVLVDGGRLAVVADSNRFTGRGAQWLSVVSVRDALLGRPALVGQVRAGSFPRQFATSPDGRTLYVTNFASGQLETIQVASLVSAAGVKAAGVGAAGVGAATVRAATLRVFTLRSATVR